MRYLQFIINDYRAITGPLEIDVDKRSLRPIIGINESGKTTILQAIFCFDYYNDDLNQEGRHLKDTTNLYKTSSPAAVIKAAIEASRLEVASALDASQEVDIKALVPVIKKKYKFPSSFVISRDLKALSYSIQGLPGIPPESEDKAARAILRKLPYILYFDDFRDKVDEKIEILDAKKGDPSGWLSIIQQLFRQTDRSLSVFALATMEERQRKSALAKVQKYLNKTLTQEWENFRLDDRDALEIAIDFLQETSTNNVVRNFLKLDIVETDINGDQHYFFISDRSKGFFWFFNFVMKLEFNPKVLSQDDQNTIYLLDEPGSYLHASAQVKLCSKLRSLSKRNRVIYCTHSHYLLEPEIIPISNIVVAHKDGTGNIRLVPIYEYKGNASEIRWAFQPVFDALRIKPFILDASNSSVVVTEGVYDYFALTLFAGSRNVRILPSVGAESIKYYISLMIAWSIAFKALWDNDRVGRKYKSDAETYFGEELSRGRLFVLPSEESRSDCILQNLFIGADLTIVRTELGLSLQSSFEKTISALFFSPDNARIVSKLSDATLNNFERVFKHIGI